MHRATKQVVEISPSFRRFVVLLCGVVTIAAAGCGHDGRVAVEVGVSARELGAEVGEAASFGVEVGRCSGEGSTVRVGASAAASLVAVTSFTTASPVASGKLNTPDTATAAAASSNTAKPPTAQIQRLRRAFGARAGAAGTPATSGAPHCPQKRTPGRFCAPQPGQT